MKNKYIYAYMLDDAKEKANEAAIQGYKIVGVEAEWGDKDLKDVYVDADASLSHHGKFSNQTPPCIRWNLYNQYKDNTCFIFSHFDLDSVFGCWLLEGRIPDNQDMREITEHIAWCDVNGGHRSHEDYNNYKKWGFLLKEISIKLKDMKKNKKIAKTIINELNSFFIKAYNNYKGNNHVYSDKTDKDAYNALDKMFSIQNKLHVFMSYTNYLNKYFIEYKDFVSVSEINILYDTKKKRVAIGVYNEQLAKKYFGESGVVSILKKYFGDEAGGRLTVGGSPKNQEVSFNDFINMVREIKNGFKDEHEYQQ